MNREHWSYVEIRPTNWDTGCPGDYSGFRPSAQFLWHVLDIRQDQDSIFQKFDKDSIRRRVLRAERAGVTEKCGNSQDLLEHFYGLFVLTRARHRIPPMPGAWFQNLVKYLGGSLQIRIAYAKKAPIAAVLTLHFRDTVLYKYGCSDSQYKNIGAMPWLFWRAISAAKISGASYFDLGRTEKGNVGLRIFKDHFVPKPRPLVYWKYPPAPDSTEDWKIRLAKRIFSGMPNGMLRLIGSAAYKHVG
jgi:lipid II:glycine glycyltransferase (peptidoglycan interpeptide bridge formation enzyme)